MTLVQWEEVPLVSACCANQNNHGGVRGWQGMGGWESQNLGNKAPRQKDNEYETDTRKHTSSLVDKS